MDVARRITDLDVMTQISAECRGMYSTALEVLTLYPDYALSTFRKLLELMVGMVGAKHQLNFGNQDLCSHINHLHECQLISYAAKDDCHRIRLWGNQAVHAPSQVSGAKEPHESSKGQAGDVETGKKAREVFIAVLDEFHRLLVSKSSRMLIVPAEVPDQVPGQVIGKAIADENSFDVKMQAGLVLEAEWMNACGRGGLISTRVSAEHAKSLKAMAIEMYRCACEVSARLDSMSMVSITMEGGFEALWLRRSDTEALFRFGSLAYTAEPVTDMERLAVAAIKEAAHRRHPQACVYYGDYLRQVGEFGEAEEMLTFGATSEQSQAYLGLFFLYSTAESPCYSPEKAIGILEKGVSRDDPDCKFQLGVALHDGESAAQDKARARQLLTEAAQQGVKRAAAYLNLVVDDTFQRHLQMVGLSLLASVNSERDKYKSSLIRRNDPCPCQSGSKYKKCHGR